MSNESDEQDTDETEVIRIGPYTRSKKRIEEPEVFVDVANRLLGREKNRFEWLQDPKISPYQVATWEAEIKECETALQKLRELIPDFDEALAAYDAQRQERS